MVILTALGGIGSVEILGLVFNLAMILMMWFTISRKIKKENKEAMESKLDSTEFDSYRSSHEKVHDVEEIHNKESRDQIKAIYQHLLGNK